MKVKSGITKKCEACKADFYVPAYRIETARFCSLYCQNHKQYESTRNVHKCQTCKKEFTTAPSHYKKRVYCSLECRSAAACDAKERRRNIKAIQLLKRTTNQSRDLKTLLRSIRRKIECYVCGYNQFDFCIDVHHLDENCQNNHPSNLICLCCMCHRKFHKNVLYLGMNDDYVI